MKMNPHQQALKGTRDRYRARYGATSPSLRDSVQQEYVRAFVALNKSYKNRFQGFYGKVVEVYFDGKVSDQYVYATITVQGIDGLDYRFDRNFASREELVQSDLWKIGHQISAFSHNFRKDAKPSYIQFDGVPYYSEDLSRIGLRGMEGSLRDVEVLTRFTNIRLLNFRKYIEKRAPAGNRPEAYPGK